METNSQEDFIQGHPDRDWPEHFEHENGNYINKCHECHLWFRGHKRTPVCKQCFNKEPDWKSLSEKQCPNHLPAVYPGCWLEGEMVGFARCMVKRVLPLKSEVSSLKEKLDFINLSNAKLYEENKILKEENEQMKGVYKLQTCFRATTTGGCMYPKCDC